MNKTYKGEIESLTEKQIFVFGSNTQGRHGKGGALKAKEKFGAIYGQAKGLQGQSYAIITKDISTYPHKSNDMKSIMSQIKVLYDKAKEMKDSEFFVCYAGTGTNLNGYSPEEMVTMFGHFNIPENIVFEEKFYELILKYREKEFSKFLNFLTGDTLTMIQDKMKKEKDNL